MKKFYSMIALALMMGMGANAQTNDTPNRMVINSPLGTKAYAIDKVGDVTFAKRDGEVKADVEVLRYEKSDTKGDVIHVKVTRSDEKVSYRIDVLPTNTANKYDDDVMARYFDMQKGDAFYQDFTDAELTGFETVLSPNASYTVVTLAYDEYGVPCKTSRSEFRTPKTPTVGTPSVTYKVDEVTTGSFTITVTPNADCAGYYWCQFAKGGMQEQFEQWGPMMGFANVEDMVKSFSQIIHQGTETETWNGLAPNTDYEVQVLPVDVDGNYGDLVPVYVTTSKLGGEGTALVDITVGNFEKSGDSYLQTVTFTPNDQTAMFRDGIVTKDGYEKNGGEEWAVGYLQTEYPFDMPGWNQYSTDNYTYEAEFATTYYGMALAKNANNEWGPLVKKEFTTPAAPAAVAPAKVKAANAASAVMQRIASKEVKRGGVVPVRTTVKLVDAK